jgi:hypothetical protein
LTRSSGDGEKMKKVEAAAVDTGGRIDRRRYSVVRRFFIRTFLHIIFWDIFMNRPVLRWLRKNPTQTVADTQSKLSSTGNRDGRGAD